MSSAHLKLKVPTLTSGQQPSPRCGLENPSRWKINVKVATWSLFLSPSFACGETSRFLRWYLRDNDIVENITRRNRKQVARANVTHDDNVMQDAGSQRHATPVSQTLSIILSHGSDNVSLCRSTMTSETACQITRELAAIVKVDKFRAIHSVYWIIQQAWYYLILRN